MSLENRLHYIGNLVKLLRDLLGYDKDITVPHVNLVELHTGLLGHDKDITAVDIRTQNFTVY